jgi:hypothetical protein
MTNKNEKKINWTIVDEYLEAGCVGTEIAPVLGVCPDTLYRHTLDKFGMTFAAYSQEKKAKGDALIRKKQHDKALSGDNMMLVWLGKNRLKQRDTPQEIEISTETAKNFNDIMGQLSSLQRNKEDKSSNTESIS